MSRQAGAPHSLRAFDFELHAYSNEAMKLFSKAASLGDFGAHSKTASGNVGDVESAIVQTLDHMDRNGVEVGLVSGPDNSVVRRWVGEHPNRFLASFRPDLTIDPGPGAEAFEREVETGTWKALGELGLPYMGRPLNDSALFPYYEVCQRHGLPASFHCGLNGPEPSRRGVEKFRVELGDPLLLQDVVAEFPDLRIVVYHMGWPFFDHALYMLCTYRNIYMNIGAVNWFLGRSLFHRLLSETIDTVGHDRIVFGSDQMVWPHVIGLAVESVTSADFLTTEQKRAILWDNAAELLHLEG